MNTSVNLRIAAILLLSAMTPAAVQSTTIDFEGLPGMTFFSGNPVPPEARLSNQLLGAYGARFTSESASAYVAVVQLGTSHATSGINGIGGVDSSGLLSYVTAFRVEFFLPADTSVPAVTDFVSIRGDLLPTSWQPVALEAFNASGALLATVSSLDDHAVTLSISHPGIHSVRISEFDSVAWDDLTFATPLVQVPEPSSVALIGLVTLAITLFRRNRS